MFDSICKINFGSVEVIMKLSLGFPWGIFSSKQIARVIVAVMAEALGESFSLEELERNELENAAALPNVDMFMSRLLSPGERAKFLPLQKYRYFLFNCLPRR
jgi:hypothetical protein